jgi:fatty-acyl-CoA synthase
MNDASAHATLVPDSDTSATDTVIQGLGWKSALTKAAARDAIEPRPAAPAPVLVATPTLDSLPKRHADFETLDQALDYAGRGQRGMNFYDSRGRLMRVLPYATLRARALLVADQLISAGVAPGERVALIAETSPEFVSLFMGCVYAGVLPVPLPLPVSFGGRDGYVAQIRQQLVSCDPAMVVGPADLEPVLREASADMAMMFVGSWEAFEALPTRGVGRRPTKASDVAYLQYSSGSTRFPHGIAITHAALMNNLHIQALAGANLQDDERTVSWLPFYHDMGLVGTFLTVMSAQMSADYISTSDFAKRPLTWLKLISDNPYKSITYSPTFGYDITARRANPETVAQLDLSRLRLAGNGGDMIRPDVMQRFVDTFAAAGFDPRAFVPSYGLAEATLGVSFMPLGQGIVTELIDEARLSGLGLGGGLNGAGKPKRYRPMVSCGKPLPGYTIEVRGPDGALLDEGDIGRLFIKGASLMLGYFRDPEATAACLQDGWLDTGDMAFVRGGEIFIVGRAKDMIIINGKNHWPQDIEWAVEQLPGFKAGDIAAFGITTDTGEEVPAVLVQCRLSDPAERARLKQDVIAKVNQLTGMTCLVELVPPRSLPRTSSGKLSRSKARQLYLNGHLEPVDRAA